MGFKPKSEIPKPAELDRLQQREVTRNNPNIFNPYGSRRVVWRNGQATIQQDFSPEVKPLFDAQLAYLRAGPPQYAPQYDPTISGMLANVLRGMAQERFANPTRHLQTDQYGDPVMAANRVNLDKPQPDAVSLAAGQNIPRPELPSMAKPAMVQPSQAAQMAAPVNIGTLFQALGQTQIGQPQGPSGFEEALLAARQAAQQPAESPESGGQSGGFRVGRIHGRRGNSPGQQGIQGYDDLLRQLRNVTMARFV